MDKALYFTYANLVAQHIKGPEVWPVYLYGER